MLNCDKLEQLKRGGSEGDWHTAREIYIELSQEARGTPERVRIETLPPFVRLRDGGKLAAAVDDLLSDDGQEL